MRVANGIAAVGAAARRRLWPICVIALIAANAALLWKTQALKADVQRAYGRPSSSAIDWLMDSAFPSAQGGLVVPAHAEGRYLAFYVFTRYDAPFLTAESAALSRVVSRRSDIAVFGIMAYATREQARAFARRNLLLYPLLIDEDGRRLQALSPPRTPWKLVLDRARHRVAFEDAPALGAPDGNDFIRRLLSLPK